MNHIKDQENLEKIVSVISSKFNIEEIYLNRYEREFAPYELVILVSNKYVKSLGDLVPRITNSIRDYPDFRVSCYIAFQAKDKIRDGNLFLFTSCVPEKMIYKKVDSTFVLIPDTFDFDKFSKKVFALRDKELQKVSEFKEGYFFYKEKGQLSMASFMMHQAIELTYRYLEVLLSAKERTKHSIRGHHHYLKEISTMYVSIFDEENDTDQHLLNVLEDIYRATRYEDNFYVKLETLILLEIKLNQLNDNANKIYDTVILSFENYMITRNEKHLINNQIDSSITRTKELLPKNTLDMDANEKPYVREIVKEIHQLIAAPITIYLFGYRKRTFEIESILDTGFTSNYDRHYDILLIGNTDIRDFVSHLQGVLNEKLGSDFLLLSYTKEQVQKQLDKNSPFFHRILNGDALQLSSTLENETWQFHENMGVFNIEEIKKARIKWYQREHNASGFFNGGVVISNSDEVLVKATLYNLAIEQSCLGILEFFLGYYPYQYNINHLYNLCSSLWDFPNDIFPRITIEDKKLFKEFSALVKNVRYGDKNYVDWDEVYRFESRCARFLEECSNLVRSTSTIA